MGDVDSDVGTGEFESPVSRLPSQNMHPRSFEVPMKILITAFGPFDGRRLNASSQALQALKIGFPEIHTRILPVDSVIAPSRLKQAIRKLQPDVLLMLGEAAGSNSIRLETTAWNEMDFRIPDIAGRQPPKRPILPHGPESYPSTLPLADWNTMLTQAGHPVSFSDDPGRYLCNQVFYLTMNHLHMGGLPYRAGFIHLPLAADYPTEKAADALSEMLRSIRIQTSPCRTSGWISSGD